ncbi:hypothetical protein GH714_022664 [Hevea brasiliensis]|uniref:Probable UDP-N-acetylglucosamine--peptide N-acetylglucosaminyltransferase SPINDLY n=1 Tax=Hevea brasiliensis TaxID=3981 RepID=A0A6A6KW77_HEVBR|nr:hypothetical protein GH714_022664 [Hevea brasiliensis]
MISLQTGPRASLGGSARDDASFQVKLEPSSSSLSLVPFKGRDSHHEVDEDMHLALAHQMYKAGNYKQALEHSNTVYERSPLRTDNLLLLGAIYYQLHDYDMCIAKNEEALRLEPRFAECYGNMANAGRKRVILILQFVTIWLPLSCDPTLLMLGQTWLVHTCEKGRLNEAAQCCRQALALNPLLVYFFLNLGNLMKAQGLVQEAYSCYLEALRIQPTFAIAWSNLAGLFLESGDLNRALQYYKEAVKLKPMFPDAYLNLGNVYRALGMPQEAIVCYQQAVQTRPNYSVAYGNLASTYYERGQLDLAILHYKQAIACDGRFLEAYNNLGNALKDVGRVDEAIQCYNQCLALQPTHPQALTNLGNIYMEWNMASTAASYYKATLAVTTGLSAPFNNLAVIYKQQGNYADAISCYNEVLRIDPLAADGLVNRGNTYKEIGRVSEAIQDYIRAITIRPNMAEAHANLASAYKDSGHVEAAVKSYKQALLLRPDFPEATCNLLHTLQCVCSWEDRAKMFTEVEGIIRRQITMSVLPSVQPFHAIAYPIDPMLALDISRKYAAHCSMIASRFGLPPFNHPPPIPIKRDRGERLRIGYVSSDFGNHPLSHLMGSVFGMHNRENVEVFCYALSPNDGTEWRQLSGTAIIVIQKNLDVLDPTCQHKRSDYGLPEDKFIFACFNQLYKMDPEIFNTWCNILKRVPNSALWLLRFPAAGEMKLRSYAVAQGVQPEQIIFTDVAMKQEHIRRSALADLFLDTPLCNAHTTGTDILWAGLPMVTLPLEKMATRVAGSLCLATGLGDEMIVSSMKEYEKRAVSLALNPPKLQALTNKLKAVRMTCPLFDTTRWVRNLERAYFKMWNIHCSGKQPQHFKVLENDSEFPCDG